jgi:two-component system phosphate regulon response regulator PhoB
MQIAEAINWVTSGSKRIPQKAKGNRNFGIERMRTNRILVIDDDVGFTEAVCLFLRDHGYEPASALDGREAMEQIKDGHVDLAIVDYHLPGETGAQIARKILEHQPKAPIIMISSDESLMDPGSRELPVNTFLPKPLPPQKLLSIIEKIIGSDGQSHKGNGHSHSGG